MIPAVPSVPDPAHPPADPLDDPLDDLLGYQLRRASAVMMAALAAALGTTGLRPTAASVLAFIAANPATTQSDMARTLGIKRANMAPLVAELESRGLLDRVPVDGRSQGLSLTAAGADLAAEVQQIMAANDARFERGLGRAERARLMDWLRGLRSAPDS